MSYNPRIKNLKNDKIDISASYVDMRADTLSVAGNTTLTTVSGTAAQFVNITGSFNGSLLGTASYATNAGNANTVTNGVYVNTANTFSNINTFNSFYVTASVTGSDAKFTSITGTLNGLATNVLLVSTNTTLTSNNHVILASASLTNITITLPLAASSPYRQYVIKKTDLNSSKIIVSGTSGETIDGNLGREINTQYETVTLINNGISEWFIL